MKSGCLGPEKSMRLSPAYCLPSRCPRPQKTSNPLREANPTFKKCFPSYWGKENRLSDSETVEKKNNIGYNISSFEKILILPRFIRPLWFFAAKWYGGEMTISVASYLGGLPYGEARKNSFHKTLNHSRSIKCLKWIRNFLYVKFQVGILVPNLG